MNSPSFRKKGLGSAVTSPLSSVLWQHTLISQRPFHPGWVWPIFRKKTDEYTSYTLKVAIRNFKTDYKDFFSFDYLNFFVLFCFSFRLGVLDDLLETTDLPSVPP